MRKIHILILLMTLAGASWLTTLVDDGLGLVWTQSVVRNWEQFGFFNLHGKLVSNAGGFQADTHPQIYTGHRAASLYPYFLLQKIVPGPWVAHLYYALVALIVFISIWQLLGRTENSFLLGAIAILTPGYLCWQTTLDPNLLAVLAGFPFCVGVIWLLQKDRLNLVQTGWLLGLIVLYSAINWSTVFIQGMLFATLLQLPKVSRRNLFTYIILAVVPAILIVAISVLDKMTNGHENSSSGLAKIFSDYGWGNSGYGLDLSTKTAFLRMVCINLAGLLPVIVFASSEIYFHRKPGPKKPRVLFLLPCLAAVCSLATLRNYFGHHPWMSCNFILLGIILSLAARHLSDGTRETVDKIQVKPVWQCGILIIAFAYGFIVLSFYHVHNGQELDLVKFVRSHTARSATILITRDSDPKLLAVQDRIGEPLDRHVVVLDKITDADLTMTNQFWLTSVKQEGHELVASGETGKDGPSIAKWMLGWYSKIIAHRRAGDRMEFDAQYYLYR